MDTDEKLLRSLTSITRTSNDSRLSFEEKLQRILSEMVSCMGTERGSIMIAKRGRFLSVAASTDPRLIGEKQPVGGDAPSCWVFKNKKMLAIGKTADRRAFCNRFDHYRKDAFLLMPVLNQNRVIGIITLTEKIGADRFTKADQQILLTLSAHVIGALENHRLTESLRKKKRLLKQKNEKLQKLERIRTELFNMLIHDLKGPLSEVIANIDILSYTVNGDNLEYVDSARTGCDTLFRMVADLLDIARMEEGSLKLAMEKIAPSDLIRESLARLQAISKSRNVRLIQKIPDVSACLEANADRALLLRVLQNLLTNAIQFSDSGETVVVGFEPVEPHQILFYVQDNGPGIPAQYHDAVFDKFTQIGARRDGRKYSTGLGLTFCRMAVSSHQGTIRVISDGVHGSRFEFTVPRHI
jgi:two-component system sensor histidine kinase KdpD